MKLKLKRIRLDAGKPIAFIHEKDALKMNIHVSDRIKVSVKERSELAIVDIVRDLVEKGEIALSQDISERLRIKPGGFVDVSISAKPKGSALMARKIHCELYKRDELKKIMKDIVNNALTEAEIAYFVSGVHYCGMNLQETKFLTEAIVETGTRLRWKSNKIADKHSIGGVAGNRTTPIVVSICAAAGIIMPKTSSRAITTGAGTADVMEAVAKVDFSVSELRKIVEKTNACLAWGGSLGLAPADDKLIQIEKMLNLDPEPQLLASILAKKIAVGSKYVLIDIPYGEGAKVSKKEAGNLKKKFLALGKALGLKIKVVLTDGRQPIGNGIGPILEIKDILRVLMRNNPPLDLEKKSIMLSGILLEMLGKVKKGKGEKTAYEILNSGQAYKKFKEIIEAQKGSIDVSKLREAAFHEVIRARKKGKIVKIKNKGVNYMARILGCPQDKAAGMYLHKHLNNHVEKGEAILTLYSESQYKIKEARSYYNENSIIQID